MVILWVWIGFGSAWRCVIVGRLGSRWIKVLFF